MGDGGERRRGKKMPITWRARPNSGGRGGVKLRGSMTKEASAAVALIYASNSQHRV